jgi:beta-glucanase (GH16 family)
VWADEFNYSGLPDASKWGNEVGFIRNNELQYYTDRRIENSIVANGALQIIGRKEWNGGANFTSASLTTDGKFSWTYGKIEARMKLPNGQGVWPAFWLLGQNVQQVGWPKCGEIDIMELRGQSPSIINGTIHGPGYSGANAITSNYFLQNSRFDVDYHIFAVEWDATKIDFFVDGFLYKRINKSDVPGEWVYDNSFYMILNVAVGGNYLGNPNSGTPFPQKMIIDYVRVYSEPTN